MIMGVVADDLTGSHDIGIMFAKAGYITDVYTFDLNSPPVLELGALDICVLNTGSRLDSPSLTHSKVRAATRALRQAGCRQFFAKTSSAFVGPVGAQFDALLDALHRDFAVVVVGYPKNGRTTIDGVHYVHGKRLEESEFRNDPACPMTCSSLVEILQSQTRHKVGLIDHRVIARGPESVRQALTEARHSCNYAILDVVDQDSLKTIARAVYDEPVLCGSSALAEELPAIWTAVEPSHAGKRAGRGALSPHAEIQLPLPNQLGVLCAAGSLMPETLAQIRYLRDKGAAAFELNALALFDSRTRQIETDRLAESLTCRLLNGQNVVVHLPNTAAQVAQTRAAGAEKGMSETEVARLLSETLANVVASTRSRCGVDRLVIAGGETATAVCTRLGVQAMRVLYEIQPGLPSCVSLGDAPFLLVLKSGSFGTPDLFEQAITHLQGLGGS